ncbi:MAG: oligosaccharide flippase family protein [Blastocatellia bacterium]
MIVTKIPNQKSFVERAAWLTGANFVVFALSFVTPLVIVRIFDQAQFGTYKQLFQILTTFMAALYLQVPMSAYYFMPRELNKQMQVAMNIVLFYLVVGLLVALVFAAYPTWITCIFHNPALDEHIPLLGVALALWLIATNIEIFPLALGDVRTASGFSVLAQISKSLILISAAVMFGSLKAILWGSIIQGAIQCVFMLGYIHFRIGSLKVHPKQIFDWPLLKKQLANSLPYGGGATAQSLRSDLHNYFVSHYFSPAAFAVYANGCFQVPLVSLLQGSFANALTPEVARLEASGDYKAIIHVWLNAMRKLSFVILPACALLFVVRRELIVTLFTEAYADSTPIFSIYLAVMTMQVVLTASIMRSIADFRYYRLKFNLIQIPLACVALYTGIKLGGLIGAITAAACVNVFDVVVSVTAICRKLGVKRKDLGQLAPAANAAPAIIIAMIVSSAVKTLIAPAHPIVILGVCAVVFALIYLVGAFLFGALTPEDKDAIYTRARRLSRKFTFMKAPKPATTPDSQRLNQTYPRPVSPASPVNPISPSSPASPASPSSPASPVSPVRRRPLRIKLPREFTPEFKASAVLQLMQDAGSAARICRELRIDESLLSDWKNQFLRRASSIFEKQPDNAATNERFAEIERLVERLKLEMENERIAELERLVGRLTLELEESKRTPTMLSAAARGNESP